MSMSKFMRINWLKLIGLIGIGYVSVVTILYLDAYWNTIHLFSPIDTSAFSEYGSHIAGIGAVFAFVFAFASFWKIESSNKMKVFETTFFNMLNHFDTIIAQIKVSNENRSINVAHKIQLDKDYHGRAALNVLLQDFINNINNGTTIEEFIDDYPEDLVDLLPIRWAKTYERNLESLPHYFRYYYTLVKFIMKSDKSIDKKFYANLLQAKMSSSEMGLIFYNTFYNDKIYSQQGAQEFIKWLNDPSISLLENIDSKSVLDIADLRKRCPDIQFKFDLLTKRKDHEKQNPNG